MRATVRRDQASQFRPFPLTAALIPAVPFLSFPPFSPSVIPARLKRESILAQIPKSSAGEPYEIDT